VVLVSVDDFRQELLVQMGRALKSGAGNVLINAPDLYRSVGGSPGSSHGMPFCCDAMQGEMKPGDLLLVERTSPAGMTVRYFLPRNAP
jgi:hypothetical protein